MKYHRSRYGFSLATFVVLAGTIMGTPLANAGDGPFGIDHRLAYDNSGIWKRSYQKDLAFGSAVFVLGGALWEGGETTFGDTLWRSVDAMVLTEGTSIAAKFVFSRERPSQTSDPDKFFTGHGNDSFPSGEVAHITSIVTPFMIEYGQDHPAVYALAALPVYDAIARMKVRGHWQSDVIAGAGVGFGVGWYSMHREHPLILTALPGGFMAGFRKEF
jgi:PAP2 superfamily